MMSMNSNKRKGRPANNSKLGRAKLYNDKAISFDGVYGNSRLMHSAASLVGCLVEIQVKDGTIYEGILRTFSHQFDLVLEMTHKVKDGAPAPSGVGPALSNLLASFPFEDGISDKLIFRLCDIVTLTASNVDADFALKETFTDTAISKFNGLIMEKELEPWDGASSDSENITLAVEEDSSGANGWDANDMFRTNAEKYGVKSSYDTSMQEYTVVLTRKDTEDYKQKEAKASKIAHEIEMNMGYQGRIQLENGDEEDRFSAVVRPADDGVSKYVLPQKRRPGQGGPKRPLNSAPAPKPYPPSGVVPKQFPAHLQMAPPPAPPAKETGDVSLNGGVPVVEQTADPSSKAYVLCHPSTQTLPPRIERRRENERKLSLQKGRTDEIEEFRKFSSNFKLTDENKDASESREEFANADKSESTLLANKLAEQVKIEKDTETKTDISKSTLNPNAKEFVFNPNAKSFTPRSVPASSPQNREVQPIQQQQSQQQQQQPQRLQAQSPVIVVPHSQMIQGLPQPLFTAMAAPQYVMQAAPFTATHQPPRFRKVPLGMQPRHEITPSMHVAAATGQPILAPASMPTMQYAAAPQLHSSGPPQQTMGYPQMNFVVGPRVVSPQPVGVVPTSHSVSYCDASHLPAHLLMPQQSQQQHHPPQSQTPVLHPSPSPVHSQPPTVMYQTAHLQQQQLQHHHMTAHHHHAAATGAHHHHPGYPSGGPQPLVLMQSQQSQQQQPPPQLHHHPQLHMVQGGGHHHMLPQMTIIPTSGPTSTPPFITQHPQGRFSPSIRHIQL
ncbi:hypothetical protein JTE90_000922 [Oedothorax gibbosus]|uniref:Sm domain-containing protein n=1 Tax=Oedothorax gibbosus TaxID=931172 RepID=A0AAV6VT22_9ARAC|nr:hypothetical protein JTE90_000922 [Oedothorax gibbosus]